MAFKDKYCVIGRNCGKVSSEYQRKWFDTEEEAVDHAKHLLQDRDPGAQPCFVAKVTQVVEIPGPPIVTRRPKSTDW